MVEGLALLSFYSHCDVLHPRGPAFCPVCCCPTSPLSLLPYVSSLASHAAHSSARRRYKLQELQYEMDSLQAHRQAADYSETAATRDGDSVVSEVVAAAAVVKWQ